MEIDWNQVDLTQPTHFLVEQLGVSASTVNYHKRKKQVNWKIVDWDRPNWVIVKHCNFSTSTISMKRKIYSPETFNRMRG